MQAEVSSQSSKSIKILIIENSLHVTGAFKSSLVLFDILTKNHEIEFVLPIQSKVKPELEYREIIYHELPMSEIGRSWKKLFRYIPQLGTNTLHLYRLISNRNIDIVIINDYYNLLGASVKLMGWRGQLFTFVRLLPKSQNKLLNHVWTFIALRFSDKVIAVSHSVRNQLPQSKKIEVIYDRFLFNERYPERPANWEQKDYVDCLYLANYIAGKGHASAIEAFSLAYDLNRKLRLRFVGSDMELKKNILLKQTLQQQVNTLGLQKAVSFQDFSNDVEKEIKLSDIVLNFSESESFSYTCLEACAYGRPIIATRCGGPEEIIDDGVSGFLVAIRDIPAMVNALLTLSGNAVLRERMGRAGRVIVRKRFSEDKLGASITNLCKF